MAITLGILVKLYTAQAHRMFKQVAEANYNFSLTRVVPKV